MIKKKDKQKLEQYTHLYAIINYYSSECEDKLVIDGKRFSNGFLGITNNCVYIDFYKLLSYNTRSKKYNNFCIYGSNDSVEGIMEWKLLYKQDGKVDYFIDQWE